MLLFAVTGITLNHAGQIEANARVVTIEQEVPAAVRAEVQAYLESVDLNVEHPLPGALRDWLAREASVQVGTRLAEWSESDIYLSMPRPGGDAWLSVDLETGELLYESTSRGAIAYLNDLHKGRNTGTAWSWFIDLFSVACIVFCITGLILLQRHSKSRPATWPVVGFGVVIPALLALLFIH